MPTSHLLRSALPSHKNWLAAQPGGRFAVPILCYVQTMTVWHEVDVDHPEAELLKDLHGILEDLSWVESAMGEYLRHGDSILRQGLWIAGVIRYARCFASGDRYRLKQDDVIDDLDENLRELHEYVKNLRNRHIAHSENPYENNSITTRVPHPIPDDWESRGITGYGQTWYGLIPADDVADGLAELAVTVRGIVEKRFDNEKKRVEEVLRNLTVEQIREWQVRKRQHPSTSDVSRRRPRIKARDSRASNDSQ